MTAPAATPETPETPAGLCFPSHARCRQRARASRPPAIDAQSDPDG